MNKRATLTVLAVLFFGPVIAAYVWFFHLGDIRPGTVNRGMQMPGHMGQIQRTTQHLEIIQVRGEDNLLLIKGSIPGSEGDYVIIREAKKMNRDQGVTAHDPRRSFLTQHAPRTTSSPLSHFQQQVLALHGIAHLHREFADQTRYGRINRRLHFHGFEHDQLVTFF